MAKIKKYGQSAVSGKDMRLKKKVKPVNQGGGPNFLGKVETVTVPKQWLSAPDHVVAELAYITPAEQKILIEADLYGSLNGTPNRGPAGLLSLQGDMGSGGYGGGAGDDPAGTDSAADAASDNSADAADDEMGDADIGGFTGGYQDDVESDPGFGEKGGALDMALKSVFDSPYSMTGILGRTLDSVFGLGTRGHTAGDTEGDGPEYMPTLKPRNPATGQCDVGYVFDPDTQSCRLDTMGARPGSGLAAAGLPAMPSPGGYARMGLLDVAPTGLPQFAQQYGTGFGTPSGFADANLAFRRQGAYRPQNFQNPYPTTGYTLLS